MDWLPRMLNDGTPIPLPLSRRPEPGSPEWQALNAEIPERPEPTDLERELEHAATVKPEPHSEAPFVYVLTKDDLTTSTPDDPESEESRPTVITPIANRLIALFDTDQYHGYQMDWDEQHDFFHVTVDFRFTGAEGRALEEYHNKNVREQEEEFQRDLPEIRRQLAEAGIKIEPRKAG